MPQAPFPAARALPRTVEAEHFDAGGSGVAYHDYDAVNQGNSNLRPGEGVDIDTAGGITNIGYTRDGESLATRSTRPPPASFVLTLYAANPDPATKVVKVYLDGAPAGQVPVGPTGGWTTYQGFAGSAPLAFPQGRHVVTIAFEGVNRINLDRLVFSTAAAVRDDDRRAHASWRRPPPVAFPTSTATPTVKPERQNATLPALPGVASAPRDPDNDGRYEDVNGNGRIDFSDVTLLFNNLDTVTDYLPAAFDFNKNGRMRLQRRNRALRPALRPPPTFIYSRFHPLSRTAMENVLIVYAAPEPKSLNGALLAAALKTLGDQGLHVEVSDLYGMEFKAVLDASDFPDRRDTDRLRPGRRADARHRLRVDRTGHRSRDREGPSRRPADLPVPDLVDLDAGHPQGLVRPRLRPGVRGEPRHGRGVRPRAPPG